MMLIGGKHRGRRLSLCSWRAITTLCDYHHHRRRRRPPSPQSNEDPCSLMKENGVQICSQLWASSFSNQIKTYANLTGFLRTFDLWVLAYQRCYGDEMGSFPPRDSIHYAVLRDLLSLRDAVLHSQYPWGMRTHHYIRSPRQNPMTRLISKRKLRLMLEQCTTTFQDRIMQDVLLMVLEPIFESRFSRRSFAFRPGRSAHTVIRTILLGICGSSDLGCIFERLDVDSLVGFLENTVKDRKVLAIVKAGKAGFGGDRRGGGPEQWPQSAAPAM